MTPTHESLPERMIREAMERGEFDNLPGEGEPLVDLNDDPNWWVKAWIDRERLRPADSVEQTSEPSDMAVAPVSLPEHSD